MLITCPYCGPRDLSEFTYQGDGNRTRPDPASTDQAAWNAYVYDRREHRPATTARSGSIPAAAARIWRSSRNTLTHEISERRLRPRRRHEPDAAPQGGRPGMSPRRTDIRRPHRPPRAPSASPSTASR